MKKFVSIIFIAITISVIFSSQKKLFVIQREIDRTIIEHPLYIPSSEVFKTISLGYDAFVADLLWLDAVQYIGGHAKTKKPEILYAYLDTITDIDPHFSYAYEVGELLLPEKRDDHNAIKLAQKGILFTRDNWRIPFYLAFIYHFTEQDYEKAGHYYTFASTFREAPEVAKTLAASAKSRAVKHTDALRMWISIYETSDNEFVKTLAETNVIREMNFIFLEKKRKEYVGKFDRDIEHINDLVSSGITKKLPEDPQKLLYIWNRTKKIFELQ